MAKRRKKKKSNAFPKVILFLLVLACALTVGFVYVKYNPKVQETNNDIQEISKYLDENILLEANEDLVFPLSIEGYDDIKLKWSTKNCEIISEDGKVTKPSYLEGDQKVTIKVEYLIENSDTLFNLAWGFLGTKELSKEFTILVKANDATALEKVNLIEAGILVPEYTNCNIGLLLEDKIFESVKIEWTSSNNGVINNKGEKQGLGEATLTVKLSCEDVEKTNSYNIKVGEELPVVLDQDVNFDSLKKGIYSGDLETSNIKFVNAIFTEDEEGKVDEESISENVDKVVRIKSTKDSSGYFVTTKSILNPKEISFRYGLKSSDASKVNKNSFVKVYYSLDNENWTLLTENKITSDKVDYKKELDINNEVYLKVEFVTEYAELTLDIDDFKVTRSINNNDVIEALNKSFSTKFSLSRVLPLTTIYGGVIEWTSSDNEVINQFGKVNRKEDTSKVTLTSKVLGFANDININYDVNVQGTNSVLPVEVYFIDLGKYGLSDCGESIYIKLGNIDVLVDAGDDIKTSNQAIKETIDLYSEDKIFEYIIATHPDSDHIGGMPFIFENYEVKNLIQFNGDHTSNLYKEYVSAYENEGCNECTALESYNNQNGCKRIIELGTDVFIEILNTQNYEGKETNTRSIVCILDAYGVRTLLTGDADNGSNSNLENDYKDTVGDIDILKAVHHGTANGTTSAFLEAVDPETVIVCNGNYLGNKHGHPSPDAINRIYQYDSSIEIYAIVGGDSEECSETSSGSYKCEVEDGMVDRNGTIKLTINESGYSISSEYYEDKPLEFSSTNYWKSNPLKEYAYQ